MEDLNTSYTDKDSQNIIVYPVLEESSNQNDNDCGYCTQNFTNANLFVNWFFERSLQVVDLIETYEHEEDRYEYSKVSDSCKGFQIVVCCKKVKKKHEDDAN
jgi:hypothetical protein